LHFTAGDCNNRGLRGKADTALRGRFRSQVRFVSGFAETRIFTDDLLGGLIQVVAEFGCTFIVRSGAVRAPVRIVPATSRMRAAVYDSARRIGAILL
jgi:hypothetical protein